MRALRGGHFATGELGAQIAILQYTRPHIVSTGVGFRMAYTPRTDTSDVVDSSRARRRCSGSG